MGAAEDLSWMKPWEEEDHELVFFAGWVNKQIAYGKWDNLDIAAMMLMITMKEVSTEVVLLFLRSTLMFRNTIPFWRMLRNKAKRYYSNRGYDIEVLLKGLLDA